MDDDDFVRDARKGKAKVVDDDQISLPPPPIPKTYTDLGGDSIYLKIVGPAKEPEAVETDSPESVKKIQFRFRNKEIQRILGREDERITNIHTSSGATIGILTDATSKIHRQLYLELLGTADEVKIAELLITDAITEAYERPYVPRALMPMHICNHSMTLLLTEIVPLLGLNDINLLKLESESGTWIEVDTYPPEGKFLERVVNIYGQGLDVSKAITMINECLSKSEGYVKVENEVGVEELGSEESGERMEDEEHKEDEEDELGIKEGDDEFGNEMED